MCRISDKKEKIYKFTTSKGFTLAEVLITLAIIGIIAALTIPGLVTNIKNQDTVSRLKKAYSILSLATIQLATDYNDDFGTSNLFLSTDTPAVNNLNTINAYASKLNVIKNCGNNAASGCWPNVITLRLDGISWQNLTISPFGTAILADGSLILTSTSNNNCGIFTSGVLTNVCGRIYVDINGAKGPNQVGRDFFGFLITKNALYPMGTDNSGVYADTNVVGYGRTAQILLENAVNY